MNTLLNYPGAKWGMAAEIVSLMPPHRSYLEPFFGSGAVLFNKPPSAIETVNDIDGDVVNFFRILRERPDDLAAAIALTPYAREVFDDAHANRGVDDFDRRFALEEQGLIPTDRTFRWAMLEVQPKFVPIVGGVTIQSFSAPMEKGDLSELSKANDCHRRNQMYP